MQSHAICDDDDDDDTDLFLRAIHAVIVIFHWNSRVKRNHNNDTTHYTEQNIGKLEFFLHQFDLLYLLFLFCYFAISVALTFSVVLLDIQLKYLQSFVFFFGFIFSPSEDETDSRPTFECNEMQT